MLKFKRKFRRLKVKECLTRAEYLGIEYSTRITAVCSSILRYLTGSPKSLCNLIASQVTSQITNCSFCFLVLFSQRNTVVFHTCARVTHCRSWFRHCATSQKIKVSIPDDRHSGRSMALGSIQALTEMSTRNISWG